MGPYGKAPTKFQAAVNRAQAHSRLAARKAGHLAFGAAPVAGATPRREALGVEPAGPINPRVRPAWTGENRPRGKDKDTEVEIGLGI